MPLNQDPLLLAALAGVLLLAIGAAIAVLRRRGREEAYYPDEEREPEDHDAAVPLAARPAPAGDGSRIEIAIAPEGLFIGLTGATFAYSATVINHTRTHLVSLRIAADMIAAHASLESERQLRGPDMDHAQLHRISRLDPGESHSWRARLDLPLDQIRPLVREDAELMLPLVRLRVVSAGAPPFRRNFVLGLPPVEEGGKLRPLPMGKGPVELVELAVRELD